VAAPAEDLIGQSELRTTPAKRDQIPNSREAT